MTDFLQSPLAWPFPAEDVHDGVPLGNGLFGALVWGGDGGLRVTVNRADYWDHQGGLKWTEEASYSRLRELLAANDEAELRRVFEGRDAAGERPRKPTRLPMGSIDLEWRDAARFSDAELDMFAGEARVTGVGDGGGVRVRLTLPREGAALAALIEGPAAKRVTIVPRPPDAPEVAQELRSRGYPPAEVFTTDGVSGWVQERPNEPALVVAWRVARVSASKTAAFLTAVYVDSGASARERATRELSVLAAEGYEGIADRAAAWYRRYWREACRVRLPERDMELLHYLGLYKLAGLSMPGSPAATLQGPWVEDHRIPPWACDYHFNINVQECYWPAFPGNHPEALLPLIEMLEEWTPQLREYARILTGRSDGLMLPHAVDDRCTCMGGFWTGAVDHGSTTWAGQLLWQYYLYTEDRDFLARTAYPFLKGCMRVYEAMLEPDGAGSCLPVSVSPEWGGAEGKAYGRNASFQLAAVHWLCRVLIGASEMLRVDPEDRELWRRIVAGLPLAAEHAGATGPEIAIWDGQPHDASHRHHSHLAGVYPFDIFDLDDEDQSLLVENAMERWAVNGMGGWTGWAMPWASILCARTDRPEMAAILLRLFRQAFLTAGHGSRHDACIAGLTYWHNRDYMQVEAALAASAAVMEMLAHTRGGVLRLFPGAPREGGDASFENLRVEGAFLVSAERRDGRLARARVLSEAGGVLRLEDPGQGDAAPLSVVRSAGARELDWRPFYDIPLRKGEEITLLPT